MAPEARRRREDEVAEVGFIEQTVLDQFESLGQDTAHVGNVPVADVRTEHSMHARTERRALRVVGNGVHGIVGLAAEEKLVRKYVSDVFCPRDLASPELIELVRRLAGLRKEVEIVEESIASVADCLACVAVEQLLEFPGVQCCRVIQTDGLAVPLLPVTDEVRVEVSRPADPALEERKAQAREPPGNPREEQ